MQRSWALLVLLSIIVGAGGFTLLRMLTSTQRLAQAPNRSKPPELLSEDALAGATVLFDGDTVDGWTIAGPHEVSDETLTLGGSTAVVARLAWALEEGQRIEFDFFEAGAAGAELWFTPVLLDPQPPDSHSCTPFPFDLNLSGFLYPRWHAVTAAARHDGSSADVEIDIHPYHDDFGRNGGAQHSMPARGGCRFELEFRVAAGATLRLRNVRCR